MPKTIVQYIGPGNVRHEITVLDEEPAKKPAKKKAEPKKKK